MQAERAAMQAERAAMQAERAAMQAERAAMQAERASSGPSGPQKQTQERERMRRLVDEAVRGAVRDAMQESRATKLREVWTFLLVLIGAMRAAMPEDMPEARGAMDALLLSLRGGGGRQTSTPEPDPLLLL
jgi:hypothetical protein